MEKELKLNEAAEMVNEMATANDKMVALDKLLETYDINLEDGTPCKSDLLHKMVKIKTFVDCQRLSEKEFESLYDLRLPFKCKVINICHHMNRHHLLAVTSDGETYSIVIKEDYNGTIEATYKTTTRTCSDRTRHDCCLIGGSQYLLGTEKQAQIYKHVLVAIAYGLYDGKTYEDIYKLVVNHKDLNMFNNNIDNLELCTQSENTAHSYVMNRLLEEGIKVSLSAQEAISLRKYLKPRMRKQKVKVEN